MPYYICKTCGTQFTLTPKPPASCPICEDERQYVGWEGQDWATLDDLRVKHKNVLKTEEPRLTGIGTEPRFAIGQRALLIQSTDGNVLWDCISVIDDETVKAVKVLGGVSAIAISHPHYYSSMIEWCRAFGDPPIYIHAADREHVMRPDPAIIYWEGDTYPIGDGLTLIHTGGHFEGSAVLHWAAGADRRGALLTGDSLYVVQDRRHVSFMYSYPNLIPLSPSAVRGVLKAIEPFPYDRLYSAWFDKVVVKDAKAAVARSAERYIRAIQE